MITTCMIAESIPAYPNFPVEAPSITTKRLSIIVPVLIKTRYFMSV